VKEDEKGVPQIAADQNEVPLGDVEGVRALEDDHEPYGHEGIDHA
jgi:hypothetical protein